MIGSAAQPQPPPPGRPGRDRQLRAALGGAAVLGLALALGSCAGDTPQPLPGLDRQLQRLGASARQPALAGRWLALIAERQGRDQVQLLDLEAGRPVPLPGLNRPDAQPLSVAVDLRGERLAVVRLRGGTSELVLYRRSLAGTQLLPIEPEGVLQRVNLSADGRWLAVELSRDGRWQVDLIRLP